MGTQKKPSVIRSSKISSIGMRSGRESCPDCLAPLHRLSLDDVLVTKGGPWTQCFADLDSGLAAGRYRCKGCLTEWWQFPVVAAS